MELKGFDELLADVGELERELAAPSSFYESHREDYFRQGRHLASATLKQLKPQEMDAFEWDRKVSRILDRVTTELLAGGDGIIFSIGEPDRNADGALAPKDARPALQVMTFQDIKDWIIAGIKGEPGGKRITAIDEKTMRQKGIEGVASVVMKAYYSLNPDPRYSRLRSAIQRYFVGAREVESSPLLDAVVTAWREHFSVVIPRDLERYAARLCREF